VHGVSFNEKIGFTGFSLALNKLGIQGD